MDGVGVGVGGGLKGGAQQREFSIQTAAKVDR